MAKKADKKFQIRSEHSRVFSEDFKRSKVKALISKQIKIKDLVSLYGVSRTSIYKWIYLYSGTEKGTITVVQMESEAQKTMVLLQRLAECERVIGQKQMQIDLLEKSFEFASLELGYDVKKKYAPPVWNGLENKLTNKDTK